MPKTVQIRDIDDGEYQVLVRHAADAGMTVPQLLRREVTRIASRPSLESWLDRTRTRHSDSTPDEVHAALDELRGDWISSDPTC